MSSVEELKNRIDRIEAKLDEKSTIVNDLQMGHIKTITIVDELKHSIDGLSKSLRDIAVEIKNERKEKYEWREKALRSNMAVYISAIFLLINIVIKFIK